MFEITTRLFGKYVGKCIPNTFAGLRARYTWNKGGFYGSKKCFKEEFVLLDLSCVRKVYGGVYSNETIRDVAGNNHLET